MIHAAKASILFLLFLLLLPAVALSDVVPPREVVEAENRRIDVIEKISACTVAVFDASGKGGGSGVVITPDGFALTNFHVVAGCGAAMKCGMNDGRLYDAVIVGIDPTGDVALIQLLGRDDFPHATLGDSDTVQVGDWAAAVGNPFLLADDFCPTVTYGMISGVRRYQYPAGTLLEYTDCIQTDAAINPGNSGGPLFDATGELIGINGRGSFEKRGRVNVGVGYAISINQIKRFLPHLRSGRIVDHATLGATVSTTDDGTVLVDDILETSDAYRRGLRYSDEIVQFAGREIASANALKNALGVYPRNWRVPLLFRREGKPHETVVRLMGLHDQQALYEMVQEEAKKQIEPPQGPKPDDKPGGPKEDKPKPNRRMFQLPKPKAKLPEAVAARHESRRGYANYWYNREAQKRIWNRYVEQAELAHNGYRWQLDGTLANGEPFALRLGPGQSEASFPWGHSGAVFTEDLLSQLSPPQSGGLLLALHLWQRMLEKGLDQFGEVLYLGQLPCGPDGRLADCLVGIHAGIELRMFFDPSSGNLVAIEMYPSDETDPCEVTFADFRDSDGRRLPHRWTVRYGDHEFARLQIKEWQFAPAASDATTEEN